MPADILPQIPPPPDATELRDWTAAPAGCTLAKRQFTGRVREAAGFHIQIEGFQRENGSCSRRIIVASSPQTRLEPEAVLELASALTAAADEIEALR